MDYLRNWREYIPIKDRLSLLALAAVIVIGFADVLLVRSSIIPRWQDKGDIASQLDLAKKDLEKAEKAQKSNPDELRKQIEAAQVKLNDVASAFLSDSQAAEVSDKLYQYASENQVEIANLQTQPTPEPGEEEKGAHDVRQLQLQANGSLPNLMAFLSQIEEAALDSFLLTNVNITEGQEQHTLSMDITLYTSPYSSGAVVQPTTVTVLTGTPVLTPVVTPLGTPMPTATPLGTPVPTPTATPIVTPPPTLTVEEQLEQSLHEPWAAKDWEEVIRLIEQILAINPDYDDMNEKLYAAHVNYGRQLAAEGKLEEAKVEFTHALEIKPDGGEAIAELQALAAGETPVPSATPTPQAQYIIHVVKPGEWLYQIARDYGTTAQAIMAANGLTDSTIHAGQELRIPIQ
jgi:LysM repeat protein